MSAARFAYRLLLWLLLPYIGLHLLWRGRRQRGYLRHWGERFGRYGRRPLRPVIWVHAVSVGETRAAAPLVEALLRRYPDRELLLTHMTPTGRDTGRQLFGERVRQCYLPYDYPFAVRRFIDYFRPRLGVLLETEIWFNLIGECHATGVPLALVNARMSRRSARKYARFARLTRASLASLDLIAAQSDADADRLRQLGAPEVTVLGNLKFDLTPPPAQLVLGMELRNRFGIDRPVLLAASTRDGEEALLLDALDRLPAETLLVLVPRHPQRFDAVAALLTQQSLTWQRRSAATPLTAATRVVLGDSMGEMFAYYAACDAAFIGGSLLPLGGQNLIEACAVGKPVLVGPHTFNFTAVTEDAVTAGAALRVADASTLMTAAGRLLADRAVRQRMGRAGLEFSRRHRGATARTLERLALLI